MHVPISSADARERLVWVQVFPVVVVVVCSLPGQRRGRCRIPQNVAQPCCHLHGAKSCRKSVFPVQAQGVERDPASQTLDPSASCEGLCSRTGGCDAPTPRILKELFSVLGGISQSNGERPLNHPVSRAAQAGDLALICSSSSIDTELVVPTLSSCGSSQDAQKRNHPQRARCCLLCPWPFNSAAKTSVGKSFLLAFLNILIEIRSWLRPWPHRYIPVREGAGGAVPSEAGSGATRPARGGDHAQISGARQQETLPVRTLAQHRHR